MECIKCKKEIPDGAPYCCWCGKTANKKEKAMKPLQFQGFSRFALVRVTGFEPAAS